MQIFVGSFVATAVGQGGDGLTPLGILLQPVLNLAAGSGQISLRSPDSAVQPLLEYNYFAEASDRRRMREGVRMMVEFGAHPSFKNILGERLGPPDSALASDRALDAWMMREVGTTHHISGTCKMGPDSDAMAVTDQYGRVHGVQGLRVCDLSVLPDCVRANTNATAMMVGEKVAEFMGR
jgi:choline dehydrogenase-like flavoprotein